MFPEGMAGVVVKNKEALEPGKTGTTKIENHQVRRRFCTKMETERLEVLLLPKALRPR